MLDYGALNTHPADEPFSLSEALPLTDADADEDATPRTETGFLSIAAAKAEDSAEDTLS